MPIEVQRQLEGLPFLAGANHDANEARQRSNLEQSSDGAPGGRGNKSPRHLALAAADRGLAARQHTDRFSDSHVAVTDTARLGRERDLARLGRERDLSEARLGSAYMQVD